ncbi:MAG: hypothetical protein ACRENB_07785 [Gemmatimonadales bacterium]
MTADDLDAFHSASSTVEARVHLAECDECRAMVEMDRLVVGALAALPSFAPGEDFADRVLAGVRAPAPLVVRILRPVGLAARGRLAAAAVLAIGLGASIVWSLFNRELLLSWVQLAAVETGRALWLGVRVVATNLTSQPWYLPLREFASSPGRLVLLVGGSLVGYVVALVALRRLLTLPSGPVSHVNG